MSENKVIPVRIGEVILYCKGLVIVKLRGDHEIGIEDVKEHVEAAVKLTKGSDFVSILDGGLTLDVSDKAMTYAAKHENKKWLAFAIVVRSISERLFANYYLKFKKPIRPTKVFTTPKGAEEWLRQFIPIERPVKYDV
ncbi:MAG: hypothetical protein EPN85_12465 [Bacteroidetes bacterium]|nr:MAG: hypothetical protein EPN85_12465 [Bacteroidota bacterium]